MLLRQQLVHEQCSRACDGSGDRKSLQPCLTLEGIRTEHATDGGYRGSRREFVDHVAGADGDGVVASCASRLDMGPDEVGADLVGVGHRNLASLAHDAFRLLLSMHHGTEIIVRKEPVGLRRYLLTERCPAAAAMPQVACY